MTFAPRRFRDEWRRIFCPDRLEQKRREESVVTAISAVAGTTVPWLLAGAVFWMMGTLMTGWNAGFF